MNKKPLEILRNIIIGKRYYEFSSIEEQSRYVAMNLIFLIAIFPLSILGYFMLAFDYMRAALDFGFAFICFITIIMSRTKISLNKIPLIPVTLFGGYCSYLVFMGDFNLWAAAWVFAFPPIAIFLCRLTVGVILSSLVLIVSAIFMYTPIAPVDVDGFISARFLIASALILILTITYEYIQTVKDKKEVALKVELAREKGVVEIMKDNIAQGIFLMDKEFKILPLYSKPLVTILSYYESELAGKNFLDILSSSLDGKQLQTMKTFFSMVFSKSKSSKVLEAANPISELEYKIDDRIKILTTKFQLVEEAGSEPLIIGIINDITREKEFELELQAQREHQQMEMKNMFDVIQIDPLVFDDFIDDVETKFNTINEILKDRTLTEKQAATSFFQLVHAMKSNAFILGLEAFGQKLHTLEDDIKSVLDAGSIDVGSILSLAIKLEAMMQEKDSYIKIVNKLQAYKTTHNVGTILINSLKMAVENTAMETNKKVELKAEELDPDILESKLRKPIRDILLQCVKNSIYHGIETEEERLTKNKKPQGLLTISVKKTGGKAEVIFSDDGRGLDWEKIKAKYLKLHPEATDTSKKVLLSSIFSPEFSTSDDVNTIAGRGVGLSFVKDLVKEYNGSVNVGSSEAGLTFKFVFPFN